MLCPTCSKEMAKRPSYGEVEFDICADHGIWLEKGELAKILESFRESERSPDTSDEARQHGRYEGMFLGWISLFLEK